MDAIEAILTRRSIRRYHPEPVSQEQVKKLIPETVSPFSIIAIGHPAEQKPPADRYNEARVHRNKW